MEKVKITFNDGTEITADVNGGSYITDEMPDFPEDLTNVTIEENGTEKTVEYGQLIECASIDGRYWFAIGEVSEQQRVIADMQSSIDYIAMMSDIEF